MTLLLEELNVLLLDVCGKRSCSELWPANCIRLMYSRLKNLSNKA